MEKYKEWRLVSFDTVSTNLGQDFKYVDHSDSSLYQLYVYSSASSKSLLEAKIEETVRQASQSNLKLDLFFISRLRSIVEQCVRKQTNCSFAQTQAKPETILDWQERFSSSSKLPPQNLFFKQLYKLKSQNRPYIEYAGLTEEQNLFLNVLLDESKNVKTNCEFDIITNNKIVSELTATDNSIRISVLDLNFDSSELLKLAQMGYIVLRVTPPRMKLTQKVNPA